MTVTGIKEMDFQMVYLGSVQVLCMTHNKLIKELEQSAVDESTQLLCDEAIADQVAIMERVARDFNRLVKRKEIVQGGNNFSIFDRP